MPPQKLSVNSLQRIIDFSQNLSQGIWADDSPFMQLPGVNDKNIIDIQKKTKELTFDAYLRLKPEERKKLGLFEDK